MARTIININNLVHENISVIIAESAVILGRAETRLFDLCQQNIIKMRENPNLTESDIERMKRQELFLETQLQHAISTHTRLLNRHSFITEVRQQQESQITPDMIVKRTREKTKIISPEEGAKSCADVCSICSNDHTVLESCVTDCGHWFGAHCYGQWMRCSSAHIKLTTCPICRADNKEVTMFKERVKKPAIVLIKPAYIEKLEKEEKEKKEEKEEK
jgi:hypothetical protein